PDSWLHREVRRKVEDVFLRNDDLTGMAAYYERWIGKNPEDVEAMTRLARVFADLGRAGDSRTWLDKAGKLAPSRKELRLTLIEQLIQDQKLQDAAVQFESLDKNDPNNPDIIASWGRVLLKDAAKPVEERRKAARAVWLKLVDARPKDPLIASQVADLF